MNPLVAENLESAVAATPSVGVPAIELDHVTKRYGRGVSATPAVNGVTLNLQAGQVMGFLGPNGAGKTTVIKMICGLVTPTSGSVRVGGFDVARQRSRAVRQLGAVLEGSRNVYWSLSAWQNLMYFGRLKGMRKDQIAARAERLLRDLGLFDRRHQLVGGFSRGMQQKVAIAAALITDPPIIMLDEPTIGLDVEAARTVKDWVAHLAHDEGKTVVLTTHELRNAQELSDRIAVIRDGSVIADLPTAELLAHYAEDHFEIHIAGPPDGLSERLPVGARVDIGPEGTRITLPDSGQAALQRLLADIAGRHIPVLAVNKSHPDLEEVFIRLLRDDRAGPGSPQTDEAAISL